MVMTAKVNIKKVLIALGAVMALILALIMLFGGDSSEPEATPTLSDNNSRVQFLESFGWKVATAPTESTKVRIPETENEVFGRYNALQKSQGYDLSQYAGKTAMRYVYKVENYPGATQPVYATVLVCDDKIIGGDVTDTAARGVIGSFKMPAPTQTPAPTESSAPTEPQE